MVLYRFIPSADKKNLSIRVDLPLSSPLSILWITYCALSLSLPGSPALQQEVYQEEKAGKY